MKKKKKNKKEKTIELINTMSDRLIDTYYGITLEIQQIIKELDDNYRLEKCTNKKGKSTWKNNYLRYVVCRKKLNEEEKNKMFNVLMNLRSGGIMRDVWSQQLNIDNYGEICSLGELWNLFWVRCSYFFKSIIKDIDEFDLKIDEINKYNKLVDIIEIYAHKEGYTDTVKELVEKLNHK